MKRLWLALLVCSFVPGCFSLDDDGDGLIDIPPRSGEERDELSCADGRDNDYDGRIDCQDTDCLMRGFCGEQIPLVPVFAPENTPETCTDGVDNDEDGQFDCGDRECQGIMELCCNAEVNNVTCSNRIDDDGNGFADCTDFSCRNNPFVQVCQSETTCIKLDANGNLLGCTQMEEEEAKARQCTDRFDNDGDRRTDCNDPDCACTDACRPGCEGPENTLEACQDGLDNDVPPNGYIDCADFGCSMNPDPTIAALCMGTSGQESTLDQCTNGLDDDDDTYTDCADRSCSEVANGASMEAANHCASRAENTLDRCRDGVDNDANGYTDCGDFSCSRSDDLEIASYCLARGEHSIENCSDGRDNDDNGFTDCNDFSCQFRLISWNGRCADHSECPAGQSCYRGACLGIRGPCSEGGWIDGSSTIQGNEDGALPIDSTLEEQIAMSTAACTDGLDNDGDGYTDCEDWECNHNPRVIGTDGMPLCRFAGGRTCIVGPRAGEPCVDDAGCDGISGSCAPAGPDGWAFVCQ